MKTKSQHIVNKDVAIKTAKSFISECKLNGLTFYKVFLFGSFAKGNSNPWSDIDLLMVSNQFNDNIFDNLKLYSKVNIKYPSVETHPYPTDYFLDGDSFIIEILKESIELE
jgi:predicted nucleotidyltransferase